MEEGYSINSTSMLKVDGFYFLERILWIWIKKIDESDDYLEMERLIIFDEDADRIVAKFSRSRPPFFSFFFPSYATISNAAQHSRLSVSLNWTLMNVNLKIHENSIKFNDLIIIKLRNNSNNGIDRLMI